MDAIIGLIRAGATFVILLALMGIVAALFMIFFNLATGIDDRIAD